MTAHAERERVAGVEPERRARRAGTGRRPRTPTAISDVGVGRRRVTTVSISGVNTTNSPVMNAEFDVVVRSSPAFWNQ